jgi:hypothetical protein
MPIRHAIWKVGEKPVSLAEISLSSEAMLEQMISEDSNILSDRWMLIGRQVRTVHGGKVDLLALNQDGQIIVIELKKDLTPREVVAQALDYASWVQKLEAAEVVSIYNSFSGGKSLADEFKSRFGFSLDEEQLNGSHQIVVVASALDPSTERIIGYLNGLDVPINVIFFQVFQDGANQYLSRAWLIDPIETEFKAAVGQPGAKGEWNGEYYVSFGQGENRDWDEAVKYGFICAGGGAWYTRTLFQLEAGNRIWVNIPAWGYVGVGVVTGEAVIFKEFMVEVDGKSELFMEVAKANYHREFADDEEKSEYFVPVKWIDTKPLNSPVSEIGFFGNQNTVCRPLTLKWNFTVETLKKKFRV